ncbi:hypothetical protein FHT28_001750 [Rhizobium sp. SG570]|jgi:hypothetical protein|nr:hypothetical protein [Rhizobium sp. SG570]NRP87421.1 hypothetical protein [Ensifer adhaerens]
MHRRIYDLLELLPPIKVTLGHTLLNCGQHPAGGRYSSSFL